MKHKILIGLLLIFCGGASAQIYTPANPTIYGQQQLRSKSLLVQHIPTSSDTLLRTEDTSAQIRVINGQLMYHFGHWITAGGSVNSGTGTGGGNGGGIGTRNYTPGFTRISGGIVTWSGNGLTFNVSPIVYSYNQTILTAPAKTVTLSPADPHFNKRDGIVFDSSANISVIPGTPGLYPVDPQPDFSQMLLTYISVNAGDTIPSNIASNVIWDNDVAPDWTVSSTGITFDSKNTVSPYHSLVDIRTNGWINGSKITLSNNQAISLTNADVLEFYVKNTVVVPSTANIILTFYNNTTAISNTLAIPNYDRNNTTTYQRIAIPLSSYLFSGGSFNSITIGFNGNVSSGVYLDYFRLQNGFNGAAFSGVTTFKARTGNVVPLAGDYDVASITGLQDSLNKKQNIITFGDSTQYLRGDGSLGKFPNIERDSVSFDTNFVNLGTRGYPIISLKRKYLSSNDLDAVTQRLINDSAILQNQINSNTTSITNNLSRLINDSTVLRNLINANEAAVPLQFNPVAGTNMSLSGTYPNITFNSTATGGGGITGASIVWPGTLYNTPTTGSVNSGTLTLSPALATQQAYRLFGTASAATTPSWLSSLDSNWIPSLHSQGYYDSRYAAFGSTGGSGGGTSQWITSGNTIYYNNQAASQTAGNVGIGTSNPDPSAILDVSSFNPSYAKGFLMPRMTYSQMLNTIGVPANGLMVYVTDQNLIYYYNSSLPAWISLASSSPTLQDFRGTATPPSTIYGILQVGSNYRRNLIGGALVSMYIADTLNLTSNNATWNGVVIAPNVQTNGHTGITGNALQVQGLTNLQGLYALSTVVNGNLSVNSNASTNKILFAQYGQPTMILNGSEGQATYIGHAEAIDDGISSATSPSDFFIRSSGGASNIWFGLGNAAGTVAKMKIANNASVTIQNGGTFNTEPSSITTINSTTKGFIPPRMTYAQRNAIATPADGIVIYQTDNTPGFRFRENGAWVKASVTPDP